MEGLASFVCIVTTAFTFAFYSLTTNLKNSVDTSTVCTKKVKMVHCTVLCKLKYLVVSIDTRMERDWKRSALGKKRRVAFSLT